MLANPSFISECLDLSGNERTERCGRQGIDDETPTEEYRSVMDPILRSAGRRSDTPIVDDHPSRDGNPGERAGATPSLKSQRRHNRPSERPRRRERDRLPGSADLCGACGKNEAAERQGFRHVCHECLEEGNSRSGMS